MCSDINHQYVRDFLSIVLGEIINSNKKSLYNIILHETKQILEEIIDCDDYDMLNIFINDYGISKEKIVAEIYQIQNQFNYKSYVKFELIEWKYKNNIKLFKKYIDKNNK